MSNNLGGSRAASGMSLDAAIAALNDGLGDLDAAGTAALPVEVDDSNTVTLTIAQFVGNLTFRVTEGSPAPDAEITFFVPAAHADTTTLRRGNFNIVNDTGQAVRPQVSGQSGTAPSVAAGARAGLTMDGANVYSVAAAASVGAGGVTYDNSASDLAATDVQAAIDELDDTLDAMTGGEPVVLQSELTDFKDSVRAATTADITLSGEQTIDGVSIVADDRVLVKDQSTGSENGIYVAAAGAWARADDADEDDEVTSGMLVAVDEGTVNANQVFILTTPDPITVGTTALSFGTTTIPVYFKVLKRVNTTSYTLVQGDAGHWLRMHQPSANTVTVPPHVDVQFSIGTEITVQQWGAGTTTLAAGSGVTLRAPYGAASQTQFTFPAQFTAARLKKIFQNQWAVLIDDGLSGGAMTPFSRGTISTGTETPEPYEGAMQTATNGGASGLAAPTTTGAYVLTYTNGAAAGAITASGWDRVDDADSVLAHTVEGSVIECAAYNDGVSKRLVVTLIEDATP